MIKSEIALIRSLDSRSARREAGIFVCEGRKLVEDVLSSGLKVRKIYTTDGAGLKGFDAVPFEYVSPKDMGRISSLKTPASILALVEIPVYPAYPADPEKELVIALDDIQDPGNMGTIIRIADWFGITDIVCSEATVDCFNHKVVQATMGAIARVRVDYTDLTSYLRQNMEKDVPVYGTFMDGENIYRSDLSSNGIIVMGNEGSGISEKNAGTVTYRLGIPAFPAGSRGSESLNVAVATAIVCSEFRRREFL